ncbi:MAG: threonylcarbamoyl-AMP synthase [Bacteroidales bacterium]|nr:threonylcarbamoyl-AMP synthase [Bacteroidales bacterium]
MAQLLKIYPDNLNQKLILEVVETLQQGGVIIYPTDTVYGLGCDITKPKAVERIARIKGVKPGKANFSFVCYDLSHLSYYARQVDNDVYKLMRSHLPGPFTFILNASANVPKLFKSAKKTVGIRIPDNSIAREIVKELGNPIMSTSVHDEDEILDYTTDPERIYEKYMDIVDIVIDGGYGHNEPSTVVDCTTHPFEILRQGIGVIV